MGELPQVVLQSCACRPRGARRIEVWWKRPRISSPNSVGKHRDCRSPCTSSELSIELRTKPSLGRRHPRSTFPFDGSRTRRTALGCGWRSLPRWRSSAGSEVEGPPSRESSPSASLPRVSTSWRSRSRRGRDPIGPILGVSSRARSRCQPPRRSPPATLHQPSRSPTRWDVIYRTSRSRSGCSPGRSLTHESTWACITRPTSRWVPSWGRG